MIRRVCLPAVTEKTLQSLSVHTMKYFSIILWRIPLSSSFSTDGLVGRLLIRRRWPTAELIRVIGGGKKMGNTVCMKPPLSRVSPNWSEVYTETGCLLNWCPVGSSCPLTYSFMSHCIVKHHFDCVCTWSLIVVTSDEHVIGSKSVKLASDGFSQYLSSWYCVQSQHVSSVIWSCCLFWDLKGQLLIFLLN